MQDTKTAEKQARKLARSTAQTRVLAEGAQIQSKAQYESMVHVLAEIKTKRAAVEKQLKEFTTPLRSVIANLNAFFRAPLDNLDAAEASLKAEIVSYREQAPEVAHDLLAGDSDADVSDILPEAMEGLAFRESYKGEVVDAKKIPKKYLIPDVKALQAASKDGDPGIPGWAVTKHTSVAVTPAKVLK